MWLHTDIADRAEPYWQAAENHAETITQRTAATPLSTPLRLQRLQDTFGLSQLELDILLVCLFPELDARYRRLFGYLQDDVMRIKPTVELVLQILYPLLDQMGAGRAVFGPGAPLLANHLVVMEQDGDVPLPARSLHVEARIVSYLLDDDSPDPRLTDLVWQPSLLTTWQDLRVDEQLLERLQALAARWHQTRASGFGFTILFNGPYGSDRLAAAETICCETGTPLLMVDCTKAVRSPLAWEQIVTLCYREARLLGAAIYWAKCDVLMEPEERVDRWEKLLTAAESMPLLSFLARESAWDPIGKFHSASFTRVTFTVPGYGMRRCLWDHCLPSPDCFAKPAPDRAALVDALANAFHFTHGQMKDAVAAAWSLAIQRTPYEPQVTSEDLYTGCRRQSGKRLMSMARHITPRSDVGFDDLILPAANKRQLEELRMRIRYRSHVFSGLGLERRMGLGKGIIALFTGSSGTGKTMAAELLACEQGVDLYKVDLAAVVSKYVGETEKNLSQVFAEAENANAVIFFDEADALFGKRGEVKESRDRWANMEVNYLLQRIEEFVGTVILATNLQQNIDDAFLRRIQIVVDFPFPDAAARYQICCGLFPSSVQPPTSSELRDLTERFGLSGGSLKNAVVDATFRAVAEAGDRRPVVDTRHLVHAIAREYQKIGKPITKSEFGVEFYSWLEAEFF